ncbi:MAG: hypothetical protein ACLFOA_00425 [Desulfohalobiaceae bacterium]
MAKIQFEVQKQESVFHNPMQDMQLTRQSLEVRTDPLTKHQSLLNTGLEGKAQILFPDTDYEYLEQRGQETQESCFLCGENWQQKTPAYPEEFLPQGRLQQGQAALFPNLFPIGAYHSVIRLGDKHLRKLDDLPPELLADGFQVALDFLRKCYAYDPSMRYATMNANYLFPAGASLVHPHFQILNSPTPSTQHQLLLDKSQEYLQNNQSCYWEDLLQEEKRLGKRWIGQIGNSYWLTAFAPIGYNEIQVVWPRKQSFLQWDEQDTQDLAQGLSHVLQVWHSMRLSTFNFSCFSAPLGQDSPHFCCMMRLVNRQNVHAHHRTDDYFFQKLLQNELILNRPEDLAQWMQKGFPGN